MLENKSKIEHFKYIIQITTKNAENGEISIDLQIDLHFSNIERKLKRNRVETKHFKHIMFWKKDPEKRGSW